MLVPPSVTLDQLGKVFPTVLVTSVPPADLACMQTKQTWLGSALIPRLTKSQAELSMIADSTITKPASTVRDLGILLDTEIYHK
jgi:hypothetical protein